MWGQRPGIHAAELIGLAIGVFLLAALVGLRWIASRFHPPSPRLIQAVFLVIILAIFFFPRRVGNAMDWLLDHTFSLFGAKEDEKDSE
jgi:H+/Cl- antiporter ClcA